MKRILLPACIALIGIASCNTQKDEIPITHIDPESFPVSIALEGRSIQFDTIHGVIGAVYTSGDYYRFFTFASENFLTLTDTAFNIIGYTAHKGDGPNDVQFISPKCGKGVDISGNPVIYDIYQECLYNIDSTYNLVPKIDFSTVNAPFSPLAVIELSSGDYISLKKDFTLGLVKYDVKGDSIVNWPLGIDFPNPTEPNADLTSSHKFDYSPAHGLIAETYHGLGRVILHNEDGEVVNILSLGDVPAISDITYSSPDMIMGITMTDSYIYLLYDNDLDDTECKVYVIDYSYNPVVELIIPYAQSIKIDTANRRLIAVDANSEEHNIMVYDLPDCIVNP